MTVDRGTRAVVTLCSGPRLEHLRRQLAALRRLPRVMTVVAWIGEDEAPDLDVDVLLRVPPGVHGLRLAAARNAGADQAAALGADVLVFLDADCVPGPDLLDRYEVAAERHGTAVLCGPVTYLPSNAQVDDPGVLVAATRPHAARPSPPNGKVVLAHADQYDLFWSLSFAMAARQWTRGPRFDERYEGYGGEDTDFAFTLRAAGVPLAWVGGAHAYHQHHPTTVPPWRHLDDILRNGAVFASRWGRWPMEGWLAAFADQGAVRWDGASWRRT